MSEEVIAQASQRIAEHVSGHDLRNVQIVLHGGEPLLVGLTRMREIITQIYSTLADKCRLDLRIHTNGIRLNEKFCELFAEYGVKVGISLDGDKAANDRHRRYASGRSSYDHVIRAIELLQTERFHHLFAGLLCTIDVANDPIAVYGTLRSLRPPRVDFLLPHATWDQPPVRTERAASEYADWLIAIYDRWLADGRPFGIRTFESVLSTLAGGEPLTEALGLAPSDLAVIETDGSYEQVDSLKRAFSGAPETGFDVFTDTLDTLARHPGIVARQQGLKGLSETCQTCPVVTSCGGGLYTHRYRSGTGFANPSVYCEDLLKLIGHIESRLPDAPAAGPEPRNHSISDTNFGELAAGFGGAAAIGQLIQAQQSLRRALLAGVYQAGSSTAAVPETTRQAMRDAWSVLAAVDQSSPVTLADVADHPYVRAWAVRCLEQLRHPTARYASGDGSQPRLVGDLGHLGAIAAVAAIRASSSAKLTVPVLDGAVHLPTLGRLMVGSAPEATTGRQLSRVAIVMVDGGTVNIQAADRSWTLDITDLEYGSETGPSEWEPVRELRAPGIRVALEDTDPYRDCHEWTAASRLSPTEFARWQQSFRDAWCIIQTDHPAYVPALAAGLRVLMPLQTGPEDRDISAAARHAFGAVATALPADPVTLALLLVHEFQHVKLGAVLDLYDLFDSSDERLYRAPWREDPRPFEGLLQGTYAHMAVSDFWRVRARVETGSAAEEASQRYRLWHAHTRDAIETLDRSGSLTPLGIRFVDHMRHAV